MNKEKFIELLTKAKSDKYGNLYVEEKDVKDNPYGLREDERRWYFSLTNTVCEDLINILTDFGNYPNEHELYDRHWWNDDTLQSKIVHLTKTQLGDKNE